MASHRAPWGHRWTVQKVAQRSGWAPAGGSILWAQPKEERGSSDDANGRHGGSFEIIISNGNKTGAPDAPAGYHQISYVSSITFSIV